MNRKFCLLKQSDGDRGLLGKKKVYEIVVADNVLHCSWGMAEKTTRQTSTKVFASSQAAYAAAWEKANSKAARGYELIYSV
jgi:predicted DNA-binding WGR domain protein